jgi:hypothetical protein
LGFLDGVVDGHLNEFQVVIQFQLLLILLLTLLACFRLSIIGTSVHVYEVIILFNRKVLSQNAFYINNVGVCIIVILEYSGELINN